MARSPLALLVAAGALLAPPSCWCCRAPVRPGEALCPDCRAELPFMRGARCPRCALPAPCGRRCPAAGGAVDRAWAPVAFAGPARGLVHALTFHGAGAAADVMAAQIVAGAPPGLLAAGAALVPVPSHPRHVRARGADHARHLARLLARRTGLPVAPCLVRAGPAARQLGASSATRRAAGRLRVDVRGRPPALAVLVDDVHTTGATLQACAIALRAGGSDHVSAITYARALR
ncbi:MAG: ComF family protein [Solirubrobacteraceae bacterium]